MANINDYLNWRGDLKICEEFPFNELDSMVLARFSYLPFNRIDVKPGMTIKDISKAMADFKEDDFIYHGDMELAHNLGASKRFSNMIVSNLVDINDIQIEKQFSAITIHLSYEEIYISYEGTDKTLNGWKEDFNLAYLEHIPAQYEALVYLKDVATEYDYKKIRMGGHSKGGHLAMYAAMYSPDNIKSRIIQVDNYDGPGFSDVIIEENKNNRILEKITTYIPQESVVGRLLRHEEKIVIVQSIEKGILQHDIFSWVVLKDHVIYADDGLTEASDRMNKTVADWVKQSTPEQRKVFVDCIFDLLYNNNVPMSFDIQNALFKKTPQLIKSYMGLAPDDRKIVSDMAKMFVKSYRANKKSDHVVK